MKRFTGILFLALASAPAFAQQELIDPIAVVKQLYMTTQRQNVTDASYGVWGDGSVNFSVNYGGKYDHGKSIYGHGLTPKDALADLIRKSEALSKQIVPNAEKDKTTILSITEAAKAILLSGRSSQ